MVEKRYLRQADIAPLLGVTPQRVSQLVREPSFPAPAKVIGGRKLWRRKDVEGWKDERIPIPMHTVEVLAEYSEMVAVLTSRLGREPTDEEVGGALGVTPQEVNEIRTVAVRPFSGFEGDELAHIQLGGRDPA